FLISHSAVAESTAKLTLPPASLAKWYKPDNKRQVWLHTMFRLRRAMQAINDYADQNNQAGMQKWAEKLNKDYLKIADMIPEWKKEIKPALLPELQMFIDNADNKRVVATLNMIQRTCDDCHDTYQPLVTAIYRSPGYDDIKVKTVTGKPSDFADEMEALSIALNRVLIALDDNQQAVALQASKDLRTQLHQLGESCEQCHQEDPAPRERILGMATEQRLQSLQTSITNQQIKDSQKLMGEIGVNVCARCHNTHRTLGDLRKALLH
ncbi:MAG: hypothetical protein OEY87_04050, partial [Gammaproteobacteria bacterium]|nr:hypothetical protein [Gammaproteobacteria bacterium]